MRKLAANVGMWSVGWGLMVLVQALALPNVSSGDEPNCAPAHTSASEKGCPILGKLPYIGRLFQNLGFDRDGKATCCDDEGNVIGLEVEYCEELPASNAKCTKAGECPYCAKTEPKGACKSAEASACAAGQSYGAACTCRDSNCCATGCCCAKERAADRGGAECLDHIVLPMPPGCPGQGMLPMHAGFPGHVPFPMHPACMPPDDSERWHELIGLASENAGLKAALEMQSSLMEQKSEMLQKVAEYAAENARLQANLQLQADHNEMAKKMLELATENARLKTQADVAELKAALMQQSTQLALERERLQLKVAELEQKSRQPESIRTAKRVQSGKKQQ